MPMAAPVAATVAAVTGAVGTAAGLVGLGLQASRGQPEPPSPGMNFSQHGMGGMAPPVSGGLPPLGGQSLVPQMPQTQSPDISILGQLSRGY